MSWEIFLWTTWKLPPGELILWFPRLIFLVMYLRLTLGKFPQTNSCRTLFIWRSPPDEAPIDPFEKSPRWSLGEVPQPNIVELPRKFTEWYINHAESITVDRFVLSFTAFSLEEIKNSEVTNCYTTGKLPLGEVPRWTLEKSPKFTLDDEY